MQNHNIDIIKYLNQNQKFSGRSYLIEYGNENQQRDFAALLAYYQISGDFQENWKSTELAKRVMRVTHPDVYWVDGYSYASDIFRLNQKFNEKPLKVIDEILYFIRRALSKYVNGYVEYEQIKLTALKGIGNTKAAYYGYLSKLKEKLADVERGLNDFKQGKKLLKTHINTINDLSKQIANLEIAQKSSVLTINTVRVLTQKIQLTPVESSTKAVVVLGMENLQYEGANAWLKSLEEPPANTIIVMTTMKSERVLPTIRSRCMNIHLDKSLSGKTLLQDINNPALSEKLAKIISSGYIAIESSVDWINFAQEIEKSPVENGLLQLHQTIKDWLRIALNYKYLGESKLDPSIQIVIECLSKLDDREMRAAIVRIDKWKNAVLSNNVNLGLTITNILLLIARLLTIGKNRLGK
jgi:hypothetical protein